MYLEVIEKWPEGPYAEASRLYGAKCLIRTGKIPQAQKELAAFRASDPYGLYRGEAVLEMGRVALEHHLNPGAANGCFLLLDTWLKEARNNEPLNIEKLAVRRAATKVTTPPRKEKPPGMIETPVDFSVSQILQSEEHLYFDVQYPAEDPVFRGKPLPANFKKKNDG